MIPTSSREYKYRTRDSNTDYCYGLNNHSITSDSSNHTELLRAYDYGKLHSSNIHRVQTHHHQSNSYFSDDIGHLRDEDEYTIKSNLSQISETPTEDPPTDPGIRQFTKSPPRPNEQRIGGCFAPGIRKNNKKRKRLYKVHLTPHPGEKGELFQEEEDEDREGEEEENSNEEDDVEDVEDEDDDDTEGKGDSERAQKSNSLEESDDNMIEGDTCSSTSDGESCSRTSMTPTNDIDHGGHVKSVVKSTVFGAIPRDRARRPSWTFSQPNNQQSSTRFKVASNKNVTDEEESGHSKNLPQRREIGLEEDDGECGMEGNGSDSSESIPVIVRSFRDQDTKVLESTRSGKSCNNGRKILSSSSFTEKQIQQELSSVRNVVSKSKTPTGDTKMVVKGNNKSQHASRKTNKNSSSNILDTRIQRGVQQQQQQTTSSYHGTNFVL